MAEYPPFMNAYGTTKKILHKIKEAQTPERFTQDFLATKLGFPGGSARAFIPLAKRLSLLESDGRPTELYKSFRNSSQSKAAMAAAVRKGYQQLYERNEYAHDLDKNKLEGLILEVTGLEQGNGTAKSIAGTFQALKELADFEKSTPSTSPEEKNLKSAKADKTNNGNQEDPEPLRLNLAYTINLVLPKSDDIAVFNAIFKSLRDNLLKS